MDQTASEKLRSFSTIEWDTFKFTEDAALCFIRRNGHVMLIHKKTGLGKGKINAPGGRMCPGETARQCAIRETREEIGLTPLLLDQKAELNFIFTNGYSLRGYVFFAEDFSGTPVSTPEADPFWCPIEKIPYERMWQDDAVWLPRVLAGEKILGRFIFDEDIMLSQDIVPLVRFTE